MRVRAGFVSNSSSCSFMLIGFKIGNILQEATYTYPYQWDKFYYKLAGRYTDDGVEMVDLNQDVLNFFKEAQPDLSEYAMNGDVYQVVAYQWYDHEKLIGEELLGQLVSQAQKGDAARPAVIYAGEIDENSGSFSVEELRERY